MTIGSKGKTHTRTDHPESDDGEGKEIFERLVAKVLARNAVESVAPVNMEKAQVFETPKGRVLKVQVIGKETPDNHSKSPHDNAANNNLIDSKQTEVLVSRNSAYFRKALEEMRVKSASYKTMTNYELLIEGLALEYKPEFRAAAIETLKAVHGVAKEGNIKAVVRAKKATGPNVTVSKTVTKPRIDQLAEEQKPKRREEWRDAGAKQRSKANGWDI